MAAGGALMSKPSTQILFLCIVSILFAARAGQAKEKITFTPKQAGQSLEKREPCEIQVFRDSAPDQSYIVLGNINYHDERHRAADGALKFEVALPKIKASACKVGGDALIDVQVTEVRRLEFAMFNVRATVVRFERK
jgi:hypothetical protein